LALGDPVGSTLAADSSGNNYDGVYVGPTLGSTGAILNDANAAAQFIEGNSVNLSNGDGSRFQFSGRAAFTLEMWVKPTTIDGAFRTHLHKGSFSTGRWNLEVSADRGFAFHRTVDGVNLGPTQSVDSVRPIAGAWYHVVGTYDGTTMRLYVNGVPRGAAVVDTRDLPVITSRAEVGPYAISVIDEVAIYPAALSAKRVVDHFTAGIGELGQRHYSRFDGFSLNDRSELRVNVATGTCSCTRAT
jgi:hypothetical protein